MTKRYTLCVQWILASGDTINSSAYKRLRHWPRTDLFFEPLIWKQGKGPYPWLQNLDFMKNFGIKTLPWSFGVTTTEGRKGAMWHHKNQYGFPPQKKKKRRIRILAKLVKVERNFRGIFLVARHLIQQVMDGAYGSCSFEQIRRNWTNIDSERCIDHS